MAAGAAATSDAAAAVESDRHALEQRRRQQAAAAAAASGRIKYADPRTLPSYPSSGLAPNGAAASAAASLGWANHKTPSPGKPDTPSPASAAAALASDSRMASSRQPPANADGHKAALLAVGSAGLALKHSYAARPPAAPHDSWGNSAAVQAFHANRPASAEPPNLSHGSSAATQAFNISRSKSTKAAPPHNDKPPSTLGHDLVHTRQRASSNALDGATRAHRASMLEKVPADRAGAISVVTMTRNMFTSAPPVQIEVDERTTNDRLHQSAVDMAKKMYIHQQRMADQAKSAQSGRTDADQPSPYLNLQDAAYKQAQDRLARLHNEHMKSREYQEYYGNKTGPRHKHSVAAKLRRRLSDGDGLNNRRRSQEIREQMSMFSDKLSQVDRDKREKDREALLAAAQRNVKARLQSMDEKAYQDTGKATSSTRLSEWEVKAQRAAQALHESRSEHKGKVDIGGGKFMDPQEVDAIAAKRVQPVLDDINEKASAERERQVVLRMEEEARREEGEKQKSREREAKEMQKKMREQEKQDEKAKKQQEKQDEKARRIEEKAAKADEKRQADEDNAKPNHEPATAMLHHGEPQNGEAEGTTRPDEALGSNPPGSRPAMETDAEPPGSAQRKSDTATSPTSKVKGWIRNRFSRGKSLSEQVDKRRSFLGGAAMKEQEMSNNTSSVEKRSTSLRDVAMAGKGDSRPQSRAATGPSRHPGDGDSDRDSHGISPASTPLEEEEGEPRRLSGSPGTDASPAGLEPPRPIEDGGKRVSSSPTRDSRFREMIDR